MSTRLSAQDRRQQILQVATGLFARQGFQGTTTRQIADGARVNEALLFRHFPSKDTLYWTIIEELCSVRGRRERVNAILKSGCDDLEVFTAIAREFLVRTSHDEELTRLLWFTALENHMLSERFFRTYVAVYYEALASYIQQRIGEGKFRNIDPLLAARGFLGMVVYHFLVQELFGGKKYQKFVPEEVAGTLAAIWLAGMQAGAKTDFHPSNGHNGHRARPRKSTTK
ncbi:MAG TPA: TetR/AcrR family transcriptional regulator [Candidatus Angelobacter sp.]|nr:TetR/AcrR family transcriptional regulator [Candidatus Angelobacter sp.]